MQYLTNTSSIGVFDYFLNLLSEKYINEAFFYLPQLILILSSKDFNVNSLITFLLERCCKQMKYSILISWIVNSCVEDCKVDEKLCKKTKDIYDQLIMDTESSLVNNKRSTLWRKAAFWLKKETDINEIKKNAINKDLRQRYYMEVLDFYSKLKILCDRLKDYPKECEDKTNTRNYVLRNELGKLRNEIHKMNEKYSKDDLEASIYIKNFFRGIFLPFDDIYTVEDEYNNLIVNILPQYSMCFSTKARVPVKIVVECLRLFECVEWDKLYNTTLESQNEKEDEENNKNNISESNSDIKNEDECNNYNSIDEFNTKLVSSEETIKQKEISKILNDIKYANAHPEIEKEQRFFDELSRQKNIQLKKPTFNEQIINFREEPLETNPFGESWEKIQKEIKKNSPFQKFETYSVKAFIAKANDDLRQEVMTMQLIKEFDKIFKTAGIPLTLRPYEILVTSSSSGLIEFLNDTVSIDGLKKKIYKTRYNTLDSFFSYYFNDNYEEAQKNFAQSLAAYSLVTYLINIKDRHNGNILIDVYGNIIHIDFGFVLGISPGNNMNFETAPFKFTKEYLEILGGEDSPIFDYYKSQFTRGFIEVRKHYHVFESIIKAMAASGYSIMPCFKDRNINVVLKEFKDRFHFEKNQDEEIMSLVDSLVDEARSNWRTSQYDIYQKLTNGILP